MKFIMWLSCATVIVPLAVDSSNRSNTTLAPAKKSDNTFIINVNVNQDSRNIEKAVKSLETTLEKNLQQLIRLTNATSLGNLNTGSGKMCPIVLKLIVF